MSPVATITAGPDKPRISQVAGNDVAEVQWESDTDFRAYEVRLVDNVDATVYDGQLVESGGAGIAGQTQILQITDDELVAVSPGEGSKTLKIFVQGVAGNWSGTPLVPSDDLLPSDSLYPDA